MTHVTLPKLAEGVEKATVSYWHRTVGDTVKEGEDLVELVTDKATFNMPSPVAGKIRALMVEEGKEIKVGDVIAEIE